MKILRMTFLALVLSSLFMACNKDNDTTPPFSIEGKWTGTTGNGGYFGMNIKPGGVLERISSSGSVSATGHWQLNGNALTGDYTFTSGTVVTMQATVDKSQNKLSGTWANNGGEQGTMSATKN
ncbi:MAG TPA: hypothetical protein VFX58_10575 [Chitinophagaceae bacterium]|nr:hypothetical protein [Chitinophagaceae bacterium]